MLLQNLHFQHQVGGGYVLAFTDVSPVTQRRWSNTASFRATATIARFLLFFPPRSNTEICSLVVDKLYSPSKRLRDCLLNYFACLIDGRWIQPQYFGWVGKWVRRSNSIASLL